MENKSNYGMGLSKNHSGNTLQPLKRICVPLIFLLFNVFYTHANVLQEARLSLNLTNTPITKVLNEIEEKTGYSILVRATDINLNERINIQADNMALNDLLKEVFKANQVRFETAGKQIFVYKVRQDVAQQSIQQSLKGSVRASDGEPIIGASISIEGKSIGTITDINGNFAVSGIQEGDIIKVSYIGYNTETIRYANQNSLAITLREDQQILDEVVVVGYGTQKKVTVTGSVATTSGDNISRVPTSSVANTLVGQMPGLIANNTSGEPGYDDSELLIRGRSTTGDSSPLIVVDGVADRAGGFTRIDPNDIENVTILKDASAAIYGSRAANGVILITTKRGKQGKPTVSLSSNFGMRAPTITPKMSESWQYAEMLNEIETSIYGRNPMYTPEQIAKFRDGSDPLSYPNTDAMDWTLKKQSFQTQQNLSISGGTEHVSYFVSVGYQYQDNYYKSSASDYNQYNLRSNIDIKAHDNLKFTVNLAARQEDRNSPLYGSQDIWRYLVKFDPRVNIYWPGTDYPTPASQDNFSPATAVDGSMGYQKDKRSFFNADLTMHWDLPFILKGLSFDGGFYVDRDDRFYKRFEKAFYLYQKNGEEYVPVKYGPNNASLTEDMRQTLGITYNVRLNYQNTFANVHNVNAFVAFEQYSDRYDYLQGSRQDYLSTTIDELFAGDATTKNNDGTATEAARQNYFGRVDYDYAGKYLFQFNWRYDGSENFPKGKKFGFFPGVSLGWRMSEENFWKQNLSSIEYFKLRASWGKMGNDKINKYQFLNTYAFGSSYNAILGGDNPQPQTGIWKTRTANPNITWEVATSYNIGLEMKFLRDFNFELDLFKTKRKDILAKRNLAIPEYSGIQLPDENVGEAESKGFELLLGYNKRVNDWRFRVSGNVSYAKSKILNLDEAPGIEEWQRQTGKSIKADWLMYEAIGIFRTQDELDRLPHLENAKVGDLMFRDVDKNGIIDGNDKVRPDKTTSPEIVYGLNLGADYKNWSLNMLWQGTGRMWQYCFWESGSIGNFTKDFYENRWTENNINSKYPKVYDRMATATGEKNTFWLENASYLRLKNIELSYTLPAKALEKLPFTNLRLYISGYNLLTFTKMKNIDPETREDSQSFAGWSTPQSRVWNIGFNVNF